MLEITFTLKKYVLLIMVKKKKL